MKTVKILLVCAVGATLTALGASPAAASDDVAARRVAAAVAETTANTPAAPVGPQRLKDGVAVGRNGNLRVSVGDGTDSPRRVINGRSVYVGSARQASTVVQADDQATQLLTVIDGPQAASAYTFTFALADSMRLVAEASGEISIEDAGVTVGKIDAPWAVDAKGATVATRYEVRGSTLIQYVDHKGAAYPVTADPRITFGWYAYVTFNRSETVYIASQSSYALVVAAACGFIPGPGGAACGLLVGTQITNAALAFRNAAAASGKCAQMRWFYFPPVWGGYAGSSVVNC